MTDFLTQKKDMPKLYFIQQFKNKRFIIIAALTIIFMAASIAVWSQNQSTDNNTENTNVKRQVTTLTLGDVNNNTDEIKTSGVVKADAQVDVVALTSGTLRNVYFAVGDLVNINQSLAQIYDSSILTSANNARTTYNNSQQNLESVKMVVAENIKQAEVAVKSAEALVKSAQDNYDNAAKIQINNTNDAYNNAIIAYQSHLNSIKSALDQVDYIIDADDGEGSQLAGISATLAVKNSQSLIDARNMYLEVKAAFKNLEYMQINRNNIISGLKQLNDNLAQTKIVLDKTMVVLDNTISNINFSDSMLSAQKNAVITTRASIVGAQTAAQNTLQGLENIDLINKRELDALDNAVTAAQNQLLQAETALKNAQASKDQQILSAQSSLDNLSGQLNLINTQLSDLNVKAPIAGIITKKYVEVGAEVSPGQKIAEIAQTNLVKITFDLTSDDIYKISLGQEAYINKTLIGNITHIDPTADPVTKKVKVEVGFNNQNHDLITETFVDVSIPIQANENTLENGQFLIPLKSVSIAQTNNYVFLAQEGYAVKHSVEIGSIEGDSALVTSGLNNGDKLIIEGNRNLEGGEEISIVNE